MLIDEISVGLILLLNTWSNVKWKEVQFGFNLFECFKYRSTPINYPVIKIKDMYCSNGGNWLKKIDNHLTQPIDNR